MPYARRRHLRRRVRGFSSTTRQTTPRAPRGASNGRAVVDADVVLRRPRRNVDPNAAEPDEDADVPTGDDGARVLEGVTRAFGPFKLRLGFVAGRYALADAAVPLIDRVRTLLTTMETGPGLSSASKLRGRLSCNNSLLLDVLARLEARGEVLTVGVGRSPQRHYVPTASARLYVSGARFGTSAEEVAPPCEGAAEEARGGTREDVAPLARPTSSGVHTPTYALRKKLGDADATPYRAAGREESRIVAGAWS